MFALFEAWLYGATWSFLSGPRVGQWLSTTRLGRWVERESFERHADPFVAR